jgi:hypothetical protein
MDATVAELVQTVAGRPFVKEFTDLLHADILVRVQARQRPTPDDFATEQDSNGDVPHQARFGDS